MGILCCITSSRELREEHQGQGLSNEGLRETSTEALKDVIIPQIHPDHSFSKYGWTTVTPNAELTNRFQALLESSKDFFALPGTDKEAFKTRHGSEEGWNVVEGEKEFITIRSLDKAPAQLREAATAYWREAGALLNQILGKIAESLGLPSTSLTVFSEPCIELKRDRTQSMLRLFRYNVHGKHSKIVAEAHRDLGLLSLVLSNRPGLEVCDPNGQRWFPLEKTYNSPVLLAGRQLELLTNNRFHSGRHLVRSYSDPTPDQSRGSLAPEASYRYSVVFILRAHAPITVNTDELTTPVTGTFSRPLKGIRAGDLLKSIQASHFNINAGIEERDKQKRKLAEKRTNETDDLTDRRDS